MLTGTIDASRAKIGNRSWTSLAVAVIVLGCSLLVVLQPVDILVRHLKDDSFYYLKTANNIALGLGSTFDGINQTNGYHPLWMLNLIPIYWIIPRSPLVALRVVVITIAIYHTLAAVILYYLVSRLHNTTLGVIISLAWALSPFVLRIDLNGMESALYALLLMLLTSRIAIHFKDSEGRWNLLVGKQQALLVLGFLTALCILARLDAVFLCAAIVITGGLASIRRHEFRKSVFAILMFISPLCLLVGTYFFYNLVTFGHLNTVSGLIKSPKFPIPIREAFVSLLWPAAPLYNRLGFAVSFAGIAIAFAVAISLLVINRPLRTLAGLIWRRYDWLWLGTLQLYVYISLSQTYIFNWYYVPMILLATLVFADVVDFLVQSFKPNTTKIILLCMSASLIALYLVFAMSEFNPHKNDTVYEALRASEWIKENLPEGTIGAAWNAGVFSYFSGRQIINLDGLINSYAYDEAMRRGEGPEFVLRQGVAYVFDMYPVPDSGNSDDFFPGNGWKPYLKSYYEYRYYAHNVGVSSYFTPVFPIPERDAMFMFKVWKAVSSNAK
jgi:hypothetical protein